MPDVRLKIQPLGEYYTDALKIEAHLKDRTPAAEAKSLLSAMLYKRKDARESMVAELARKRSISFEDMWDQILAGTAEPMPEDETDSDDD